MNKRCTHSSLPAAEESLLQGALQPWIPTRASKCLPEQRAALVPAGSSIFRPHAGCTVRSPPPLLPRHAVTWCLRRPVFHKSRRPTLVRPFHNASSSPLLQATAATPGFAALSLYRSACGHRPLTSIQSCCRTPGKQQTTSKMAHRITSAASLVFFTQSQSSGTWRSMSVRAAPCLLKEPAQGVLDRTVRSGPGSPYLQETGWNGCRQRLLAHVPVIAFVQSTRGARACVALHRAVTPSPSSIAHSVPVLSVTCSWPSSTCQCQVRPAASMMACCSGGISPCSFATCTASAAAKILDCNFANAMSRARLFGGTLSADCTGAGRTISAARLSAAHGLASYNLLASFSVNTLACSSTATLLLADLPLRPELLPPPDARHDSLVQVNSRPVRCLRREAHLSNPN